VLQQRELRKRVQEREVPRRPVPDAWRHEKVLLQGGLLVHAPCPIYRRERQGRVHHSTSRLTFFDYYLFVVRAFSLFVRREICNPLIVCQLCINDTRVRLL
jgi:hypothetical protein